jgi:choline dehydrogenase-like flavoprotein
MAFVTPSSVADKYDVVVVGSGAAGGQSAYTLAMGGARVLML